MHVYLSKPQLSRDDVEIIFGLRLNSVEAFMAMDKDGDGMVRSKIYMYMHWGNVSTFSKASCSGTIPLLILFRIKLNQICNQILCCKSVSCKEKYLLQISMETIFSFMHKHGVYYRTILGGGTGESFSLAEHLEVAYSTVLNSSRQALMKVKCSRVLSLKFLVPGAR